RDWQIGRFLALENSASVGANLAIGISKARAVAHQGATGRKLSDMVDRGNRIAGREGHEPIALGVEEGIVFNHERADSLLGKHCEVRSEFRFRARAPDQ